MRVRARVRVRIKRWEVGLDVVGVR